MVRIRARLPRLGGVAAPPPLRALSTTSRTATATNYGSSSLTATGHARSGSQGTPLPPFRSSRHYSASPNDVRLPPHGPQKGDRVTVALSGGVDSSVTALLLAQASHYDLHAVFMRNWNELDESGTMQPGSGGATGCTWQRDWHDVQAVCRHLGNMPVSMVDLSREYWTQVFEPALDEWRQGTTPNPDVSCNREIKFGALMERLLPEREKGRKSWLATGHYAHVAWSEQGRPMLMRAKDRTKDQTYYLSSVAEDRLAHAHFPLAHLLKSQVRELAKKHSLPTAERRESMGICFVGTRGSDGSKGISNTQGFSTFLNGYITSPPGEIVDEHAQVVATHRGLHTLTVGQGARIRGATSKYYVAKKDIANNRIVAVQGKQHPMLLCRRLYVREIEWIWREPPPELKEGGAGKVTLLAQVRHRQVETECIVSRAKGGGSGYVVEFAEPVLAVAPGQVLGLWRGEWCLGSAVIQCVDTVYDDQTR
ncbi:related to trna methyltransferase [Sporisorium reilianum SRZ2]|uniref:tRNA-5-taurinomethyluridine 2-sulfurtransferase n=1 Tax=Sporisorium reilianum (strain SRZ2) TaxID=999809 RepID=E6ZK37_SPORE|nr:related to trna methyltransferase [Sporisorium reilianum SRZ2]